MNPFLYPRCYLIRLRGGALAAARSAVCRGLVAEAMIGGRLLLLPKNSEVFEYYGALEEAEALLARARLRVADPQLQHILQQLQEAVRAAITALAAGRAPAAVTARLEPVLEELGEPTGWLLAGCSEEEADLALAAAQVRKADRLLAAMAAKGLIDPGVAEQISALLATVANALFRVRARLCGPDAGFRDSARLLEG